MRNRIPARCIPVLALVALASACDAGPVSEGGPAPAGRVAVAVAPLALAEVHDAVWDLAVHNGAGTPALVWSVRLTASRYGDGQGSLSYVGACDADLTGGVADNTVSLRLMGLYGAQVTTPGAFGDAAPAGGLSFRDPGLLERTVRCVQDQDAAVTFDVTVARQAEQGFFDFTVSFDSIFCSAKYDCDATDLLFNADGQRAATQILAVSCTAGLDASAETVLYLDPITLDCGTGVAATIDPAATQGNYRDFSAAPGSQWSGVMFSGGFDRLYQVASHTGEQHDVASGGASVSTRYWTVALGVAGDLTGCTLHTLGTVDDGAEAGGADGGVVAVEAVYPYIDWTVDLGTCTGGNPLDGAQSGVVTEYFDSATGHAFAHSYPVSYGPSCVGEVGYVQSGTASATTTDSCVRHDYSSCSIYSASEQLSCGLCQYVSGCSGTTPGACANYTAETSCGAGFVCNTSGSCVSSGVTLRYLVVAGGGAGGGGAQAGGGAGGLLTGSLTVAGGSSHTITVGAGGSTAGGIYYHGGNSAFDTIVALGGGGLSYANGSGVVASGNGAGGVGTPGQGHNGGVGAAYSGGGGGGAGGVGGNGSSYSTGGTGGIGLTSDIAGTGAVYYAGGGGGGSWFTHGTDGAGTIGQGGHGSGDGGNNGIVILSYPATSPAASSVTGTHTVSVVGGNRIYRFTTSGSITF